MRRSTLKVTIEYHTRGLNTKEEHFSNGEKADALFRGIKSHLDGEVSQVDIEAVLAAVSTVTFMTDDDDDDEDDGIKTPTPNDDRILECMLCKCKFEDWQTASCHLVKYHLYNCAALTGVPPETLTISALWFNTLNNYMIVIRKVDSVTMESVFRNYVLKHTYDWTINELSDGAYADWWNEKRTNIV